MVDLYVLIRTPGDLKLLPYIWWALSNRRPRIRSARLTSRMQCRLRLVNYRSRQLCRSISTIHDREPQLLIRPTSGITMRCAGRARVCRLAGLPARPSGPHPIKIQVLPIPNVLRGRMESGGSGRGRKDGRVESSRSMTAATSILTSHWSTSRCLINFQKPGAPCSRLQLRSALGPCAGRSFRRGLLSASSPRRRFPTLYSQDQDERTVNVLLLRPAPSWRGGALAWHLTGVRCRRGAHLGLVASCKHASTEYPDPHSSHAVLSWLDPTRLTFQRVLGVLPLACFRLSRRSDF